MERRLSWDDLIRTLEEIRFGSPGDGPPLPFDGSRVFPTERTVKGSIRPRQGETMSIKDKVTGKAKQVAGDIADEPSLRRKGRKEEQKGKKKEQLERADEKADEKADEVADLERQT
jgi:uncharacterized protein YjbJ (UPF0337 family)